jgi:hypothetical protein
MAYQQPEALDDRGRSILTQVAFKAAVDATGVNEIDGEFDTAQFDILFPAFVSSLVEAVEAQVALVKPAPAKPQPPRNSGGGNAPEQSQPGSIRILNASKLEADGVDNGPLPTWLATQAAAKGIDAVFDNRHEATVGNKKPHFKSHKDDGSQGFWPPR